MPAFGGLTGLVGLGASSRERSSPLYLSGIFHDQEQFNPGLLSGSAAGIV
jgi:hypothetical protein